MYSNKVKTTVELPEDLIAEAKKLAAQTRSSLRNLIEEGLRARLLKETLRKQQASNQTGIRWITTAGPVPEVVDDGDRERILRWLDDKETTKSKRSDR